MSDFDVKHTTMDTNELIQLCAVNPVLFCHTFFPKAFRGMDPDFIGEVWAALENPRYHFLNLKLFRGAAKTTILRAYNARRIAYGLSRTILYIGAGEDHATRSVQWMRTQIEPRMGADGVLKKTFFAQTFGLSPGAKWQEHNIEVLQSLPKAGGGTEERTTWMLGVGITGSVRGINFDDYRPDSITLDDVLKDENSATEGQRDKLTNLILGAVKNSLAPATEEPNAKMVMLQTPLDSNDASAMAERSSEWTTFSFGCWTKDTEHLPVDQQESSWPSRYPSADLRKQKVAALAEQRYSIFAKEMEVRVVTAEQLSFRPTWIRRYTEVPKISATIISIDPVAPPSEAQKAKGLKGKDFEAIGVLGRSKDGYVLLDYVVSKGHDPEWTVKNLFEFKMRYRPQCCVLSVVSAERYLKWYIEKEMERRRNYIVLKEAPIGGQSKFARIITALSGVASQGKLWCSERHSEFILQFESYGMGYRGHDDVLEMVANGVAELTNPFLEHGALELSNDDVADFKFRRVAP